MKIFERKLNKEYQFLSKCIDKQVYFKEFNNAPIEPDEDLYLDANYPTYKAERDAYIEAESKLMFTEFENNNDLVNLHDNKRHSMINEFKELVYNKKLDSKYFSPNIKLTPTYRSLKVIQNLYNEYISTIAFEFKEIDRYKEPELFADKLMNELQKFDYETIVRIIDALISDEDIYKTNVIYTLKSNEQRNLINENRIKTFEENIKVLILNKIKNLKTKSNQDNLISYKWKAKKDGDLIPIFNRLKLYIGKTSQKQFKEVFNGFKLVEVKPITSSLSASELIYLIYLLMQEGFIEMENSMSHKRLMTCFVKIDGSPYKNTFSQILSRIKKDIDKNEFTVLSQTNKKKIENIVSP